MSNLFESDNKFYNWYQTTAGKIIIHASFWVLFLFYLTLEILGDQYDHYDIKMVMLDNGIYLMTTMFAVYSNAFYFVPYFMYEKKISIYIISFLCLVAFTSGIKMYLYNFVLATPELDPRTIFMSQFYWFFRETFEVFAISSIKIAGDWMKASNKINQQYRQQIEAEYKFLKAQVNPHFIFNTLNNIYFLINKNSPKAGQALLSLSNILRYRIYDKNEKEKNIYNEIQCIKELIELEKLRHNESLKVEFNVIGDYKHHKVEPLLFIPFVENAFKHVHPNNNGSWIKIGFKLLETEVLFTCTNSSVKVSKKEINPHSGIGILNVRNRLNLMHKGNYSLDIDDEIDFFEVKLAISFKKA